MKGVKRAKWEFGVFPKDQLERQNVSRQQSTDPHTLMLTWWMVCNIPRKYVCLGTHYDGVSFCKCLHIHVPLCSAHGLHIYVPYLYEGWSKKNPVSTQLCMEYYSFSLPLSTQWKCTTHHYWQRIGQSPLLYCLDFMHIFSFKPNPNHKSALQNIPKHKEQW